MPPPQFHLDKFFLPLCLWMYLSCHEKRVVMMPKSLPFIRINCIGSIVLRNVFHVISDQTIKQIINILNISTTTDDKTRIITEYYIHCRLDIHVCSIPFCSSWSFYLASFVFSLTILLCSWQLQDGYTEWEWFELVSRGRQTWLYFEVYMHIQGDV